MPKNPYVRRRPLWQKFLISAGLAFLPCSLISLCYFFNDEPIIGLYLLFLPALIWGVIGMINFQVTINITRFIYQQRSQGLRKGSKTYIKSSIIWDPLKKFVEAEEERVEAGKRAMWNDIGTSLKRDRGRKRSRKKKQREELVEFSVSDE